MKGFYEEMSSIIIADHLLHRDACMLVVNKPAGIPVHGGSGRSEGLDRTFGDLMFGLPHVPCLAHRLDKETSGCLILGRHKQALAHLGKLFATNQISKTYIALVEGIVETQSGIIDLPLAPKSQQSNRWQMKVDTEEGKRAITHYKVVGYDGAYTLLALLPQTGRTHQLRVHCQAIEHPIVNDRFYGSNPEPLDLLRLHAYNLVIPYYPKKDPLHVQAPVPSWVNPELALTLANDPTFCLKLDEQ